MAGNVTLLLEHFSALAAEIEQGRRFASIENLLQRSKVRQQDFTTFNELRFSMFGLGSEGDLPVAAMTRMADQQKGDQPGGQNDGYYRLRLDPVTLWADMARIVMTRSGFADLDEAERNEIENTLRSVLFAEGFDLESNHPERWTIALEEPLEFGFTPLENALGMDAAEVLPNHPEALPWRRILNEIQMALHACPVNVRRRNQGRVEINSVWFWGGGFVPTPTLGHTFHRIWSDNPVTRGLALLHDCELHDFGEIDQLSSLADDETILIDWTPLHAGADAELTHFNGFLSALIPQAERAKSTIHLRVNNATSWLFEPRNLWRRLKPGKTLDHYLASADKQ